MCRHPQRRGRRGHARRSHFTVTACGNDQGLVSPRCVTQRAYNRALAGQPAVSKLPGLRGAHLRTSMNASCGMFTLPMDLIRFLPSFHLPTFCGALILLNA